MSEHCDLCERKTDTHPLINTITTHLNTVITVQIRKRAKAMERAFQYVAMAISNGLCAKFPLEGSDLQDSKVMNFELVLSTSQSKLFGISDLDFVNVVHHVVAQIDQEMHGLKLFKVSTTASSAGFPELIRIAFGYTLL